MNLELLYKMSLDRLMKTDKKFAQDMEIVKQISDKKLESNLERIKELRGSIDSAKASAVYEHDNFNFIDLFEIEIEKLLKENDNIKNFLKEGDFYEIFDDSYFSFNVNNKLELIKTKIYMGILDLFVDSNYKKLLLEFFENLGVSVEQLNRIFDLLSCFEKPLDPRINGVSKWDDVAGFINDYLDKLLVYSNYDTDVVYNLVNEYYDAIPFMYKNDTNRLEYRLNRYIVSDDYSYIADFLEFVKTVYPDKDLRDVIYEYSSGETMRTYGINSFLPFSVEGYYLVNGISIPRFLDDPKFLIGNIINAEQKYRMDVAEDMLDETSSKEEIEKYSYRDVESMSDIIFSRKEEEDYLSYYLSDLVSVENAHALCASLESKITR